MNWRLSKYRLSVNIYLALVLRLLIVMLAMSICRAFFYIFNLSMFPIDSPLHLFILFGAGIKFDLIAVLYTNILFILGMVLPFPFRYGRVYQNVLKWIFIVTNSLALLWNCIDIIYFRFTMRRTTWDVFHEFSNDLGNVKLMLRFSTDYWYIVALWGFLLTLVIFLSKQIVAKNTTFFSNSWIRFSVNLVGMLVAITLFIGGVRGGFRHSTRPLTLADAGEYVNTPAEIGIVLNTPFSLYRTLSARALKRESFYSEEELNSIYTPVHTPKPDSAFKSLNVVVFILESFSKEFVGFYNKDLHNGTYKGYTPFLDSLCEQSKTFKWSFATGKKSIEGMPSVLASIPSIEEPFVLSKYSGNRINSLASLLSSKGYDCSFFHGAPNGSMGFSSFIKMAGYQHYYGMTEYNNNADFDGMWGIWDEPFFQYYAKTLNQKKQPFLATLFSVSSHHPFRVPAQYEGKFPKGTTPIHQCIGYTDMALRKFFATASKMPWFKNTLFVITADHTSSCVGEESYNNAVGTFAVPIIFYKPGSNLKGMEDKMIHQTDIMPSILGYLNYDKPYVAYGSDVLNVDNPQHIMVNYLNGVFQLYQGKYVLQSDLRGPIALFNYQEDKLLKHNLLKDEPEKVKELYRYFSAFKQQYNNRMIDNRLTP